MNRRNYWVAILWLLTATAFSQQASIVKDIVVRGNQRVSKAAILAAMRTKVGRTFVQDDFNRDKQSLEELGFFSSVDIHAIPADLNAYQITVDVQENPVIKEFRITGNTVVKTDDILKVITLKVGEVYNFNARKTSADAIIALYSKKGNFATIDDFSPLAESPGTVNVHIAELHVGQVLVVGNTRTKDWVMRRLIKTRAGDVFSADQWNRDLTRIHNTQWFDSVQGKTDESGVEGGKVNLIADVKEGHTGQFNVGVQLDPQENLAGVIRLSESNLYGTGKTVSLNFTQIIDGGPSVNLGYVNPFYDAKDTSMQASLYSTLTYRFGTSLFDTSSPIGDNVYYERRSGASLGFQRPITNQISLGISGKAEEVITSNSGAEPLNDFIEQDGYIVLGGLSAVRNRRDVDQDPSRGDYLKLSIEPGYSDITSVGGATSNRNILGPNTFLRNSVELREYFSPGQKPRGIDFDATRKVIAFKAKYGWITGQVPYFEQFFAGGADSLRGYYPDQFWGTQTLLLTLEYRYPLQKGFSLIAFVDDGGAWGGYGTVGTYTQNSTFRLHPSFGPGLTFKTQFGVIRVDLGFNETGGTVPDFLIGPNF